MSDLSFAPGKFVWHELMTADAEAAKAFYGALFGWAFAATASPMEAGKTYTMIRASDAPDAPEVGGILAHDGVPPHWAGYVSVPDVDAAVASTLEQGGGVCAGPFDIPGVGRWCCVRDAQGAVFFLFRSFRGDPPDFGPGNFPKKHTFCWDQLMTADADAAKAFYRRVVGWGDRPFHDVHDVHDDGDIGVFLRPDGVTAASFNPFTAAPVEVGPPSLAPPLPANSLAVANGRAPANTRAHWLPHVLVADLAAARERIVALGGSVLEAAVPVAGMGEFAIVSDGLGGASSTAAPGGALLPVSGQALC